MKQIPMRMCVACRQMFPKNTLLRIVRLEDGSVVVDRTGKRNGRGAYLCATKTCFDKAIKIRALDRALNISLSEEMKAELAKELENAGTAL